MAMVDLSLFDFIPICLDNFSQPHRNGKTLMYLKRPPGERKVMTRTYGKGVRLAALGLATATALSLAAPAFAGEKPAAAQGHDTGNGVTAAIDPATGKLRQPTAEESKALALGIQSMLKRSVQ